jgi:hypothetical protein
MTAWMLLFCTRRWLRSVCLVTGLADWQASQSEMLVRSYEYPSAAMTDS